jgi:hypothetical protein
VKPKDPNFTGTVDVYYLVKRSQLTYKNYYELPSIYTSQLENLIMFCDVSDLDVRSILEGEYSFECVNYQLNNNGLSGNANFEFTFTANPYYYDIGSDITIDIFQNGYGIFMLSGSELNNLGLGWSG